MDENEKEEILRAIQLSGGIEKITINPIVGNNPTLILELGKGLPRIKKSLADKFQLITSQPFVLSPLSNLEIRCILCGAIVRYPVWYANVKYSVNWFHYFVCFDSTSETKPTVRCYKR